MKTTLKNILIVKNIGLLKTERQEKSSQGKEKQTIIKKKRI